jgi:hypothetical protein
VTGSSLHLPNDRAHDGRATLWPAVAVMALFGARTVQGWICGVATAFSRDYGPAQLAILVDSVVRGAPLYRDFRTPPYQPLVYGPVIPWVVAHLAPIVGAGPMAALMAGRMVTIVSTIAVATAIAALARRAGASLGAAAIVALAFVLSPLVQRWGFAFRVDMPALACELGGLWAFGAGLSAPAIALFALEFFIKQGRVAGIVAVVLCCWFTGERRRAIRLVAAFAASVGAGIALTAALNPWYWLNAFGAIRVAWLDPGAPALFAAILIGADVGLVIFAGLAILRRDTRDPLALAYLAAAGTLDALACLRWGSNAYYFLPALAALAIVAAAELDSIAHRLAAARLPARIGSAIAIALLLSANFLSAGKTRAIELRTIFAPALCCAPPAIARWDPRAMARLRAVRGTVLTDDADLALIDPAPNLQWMDLMILASMRRLGTFDDSALLAEIRARKIGAFALGKAGLDRRQRGRALFWPQLRAAIEHNYVRLTDVGPPYLLVPKPASRPAPAPPSRSQSSAPRAMPRSGLRIRAPTAPRLASRDRRT